MTYEQSLALAEIQADLAFDRYIDSFNSDDHPTTVEQLSIEAQIAQARYDELSHMVQAE